jgi:hypothetical protein
VQMGSRTHLGAGQDQPEAPLAPAVGCVCCKGLLLLLHQPLPAAVHHL